MKRIKIGQREIGAGAAAMLVAEIGINHNGDMKLAQRMIDAAAEAGAEAVKFQNYRTDDFVRDRGVAYTYRVGGRSVTESQYEMFRRCELAGEQLKRLKERCDERGVIFHSTPTGFDGLRELIELGVPVLKNGSDYLTHLPLIAAMGSSGLATVLSTGMATLAEIADAVAAFRATGNDRLILLHCTSAYPTPAGDVHLRKLSTLARAFGCPVGFSDHTQGVTAAMGAVALGACWIEKHFTLDKRLAGPDHAFSADPAEFRELGQAVRTIERQLGGCLVEPAASEQASRRDFRLSCAAARALRCGEMLAAEDLLFARPGTGLPPREIDRLVGRRLTRDIACGGLVLWEDVQ